MPSSSQLLRQIPKMDELLAHPLLAGLPVPRPFVTQTARDCLDALRQEILAGTCSSLPIPDELANSIAAQVLRREQRHLRRVINGTGIVLHTNLGRANLSQKAAQAACQIGMCYSTLEYDLDAGKRGSRYSHVEHLLCELTGAESALVVNNNAAAVLLMLSTLAKDKEVPISRGELVEIGGAFRVPEIMSMSGCLLREVGTTNKTRCSDYENAITEHTGALLKVHTSNFKIVGFSEETSLCELSQLAKKHGLPLLHDLGSGALFPLDCCGVFEEPNVPQSLRDGADVVCFSGDKLLGGPQAGILLGRKRYVEQMKRNPLTRALRIDKMTLAALEETLLSYRVPEQAMKEIPALAMLSASKEELKARGLLLEEKIRAAAPQVHTRMVPSPGQVGGGSAPSQMLDGWALSLSLESLSPDEWEHRLRFAKTPVIGYIHKGDFLLNLRTIKEEELDDIASAVMEVTV